MSDVTPINGLPPAALNRTARNEPAPQPASAPTVRTADQVDLSRAARFLSQLVNGPDVRTDLVARVREEIDSGRYETPEKLEALLDELMEDLQTLPQD